MGWSRAFQKCIFYHFLDNFCCQQFYNITGFCNKKNHFLQMCNFFADSKSRAQELSNDVSLVIFGHQTWDLEGGVKLTPPQRILVFKYLSRDRVKSISFINSCKLKANF